jgi:hypothetical protein
MKKQSHSIYAYTNRGTGATVVVALLALLALAVPANARVTLEDLQAQIDALLSRVDELENPTNTVFVSSVNYTADLGGPTGADQKCNDLADAAGLLGTYKAWLGDSNTDPATRFEKSNYPYELTNGDVIADNWTDLTDGTLAFPILYTEQGLVRTIPSHMVWSNAYTTGITWAGGNHCSDWTSTTGTGFTGNSGSVGSSWALAANVDCTELRRIYCFEQ